MLSSTPALTSQVRIEDTASFLREFAKFFESNMKLKFKRELNINHASLDNPGILKKSFIRVYCMDGPYVHELRLQGRNWIR